MEKNNNRVPTWIRCGLWVATIGLLAYNSIYIKKLSVVRNARSRDFDAPAFAKRLWEQQLPARLDSAVSLQLLLAALHKDPASALDRYANAIDLGNVRYSLVKGAGKVMSVNEDDVDILTTASGTPVTVQMATEYVYGNAIRDASGLVDIKDFTQTMDLNNISAELDKRVRKEVLPAFRATVKKGDSVSFAGAVELNREHLKLDKLVLTPGKIKIIRY